MSMSNCVSSALSEPGGPDPDPRLPSRAELAGRMCRDAGFSRFTVHDFQDPADLYYEARAEPGERGPGAFHLGVYTSRRQCVLQWARYRFSHRDTAMADPPAPDRHAWPSPWWPRQSRRTCPICWVAPANRFRYPPIWCSGMPAPTVTKKMHVLMHVQIPPVPLPVGAVRQASGRHVMGPVHACRYAWSSTSGRLPGIFCA